MHKLFLLEVQLKLVETTHTQTQKKTLYNTMYYIDMEIHGNNTLLCNFTIL
jgi:hypothetical protein